MQGNWAVRGAALLLIVVLSGCAGRPVRKPAAERPGTLRALAVVELKMSGGESLSGRAVITARRPDLFRIEIKDPFLRTAALIVSDGSTVKVLTAGKKAGRTWRLMVDPPFLTALLLGDTAAQGPTTVVSPDGTVEAALSDVRTVEGARIPFTITLTSRLGTVAIRYRKVEINPQIDADLFRMPPLP